MPLVEGPILLPDKWTQKFEVEEGKGYLLLSGGRLKEARTAAGVRRRLQWRGKSGKLLKLNTAQIHMPLSVPGVLLQDGFSVTVSATASARFRFPPDDGTFEDSIRDLIGDRSFEELGRQADIAVLEAAASSLAMGFRNRTHADVDPPDLHGLRKGLFPTSCLDGLVEVRIDALTRIEPDARARQLRDAPITAQVEEGRIFVKQMEEVARHRLQIRMGLERAQAMGVPPLMAMQPELAEKMMALRAEMLRILATNGNNISVLIDTMQQLGLQPEFVEMLMSAVADPARTSSLPSQPDRADTSASGGWPFEPRAHATAPDALATGQTRAQSPEPDRWLSAELEDHPFDTPLRPDNPYTLAFGVTATLPEQSLVASRIPHELLVPEPAAQPVTDLTIQLTSTDFGIDPASQLLRLTSRGTSSGRARFKITPLHVGRCTLTATVHRNGNFLQQLTVVLSVGGLRPSVEAQALGRPVGSAARLGRRDLGLSLTPSGSGGYECVVWGAVATRVHLPITRDQLDAAVNEVREAVESVLHDRVDSEFVFQTGLDIPPDAEQRALQVLARAGARLFQHLFQHPAAGADVRQVGKWLRSVAGQAEDRLVVQIVSIGAPVPWPLLYLGSSSVGVNLSWDLFLGMHHVVEQIPFQPVLSVPDNVIVSDQPELSVGLHLNEAIDAEMTGGFVARQRRWWLD